MGKVQLEVYFQIQTFKRFQITEFVQLPFDRGNQFNQLLLLSSSKSKARHSISVLQRLLLAKKVRFPLRLTLPVESVVGHLLEVFVNVLHDRNDQISSSQDQIFGCHRLHFDTNPRSEVNVDRSEVGKKQAITKPENIAPDTHRVKRVKSAPDGLTRTNATVDPQKSKSEQSSLAKALNETINSNDHSPVSNAELVSKYWREITMKLPPEVKSLPTIDRLAYYFRESELAKEENAILKRDESERRKSMVLLAEKIKLMNQPVARRK